MKEVDKIVKKYDSLITNKLKSIAGVDTGTLKASIITENNGEDLIVSFVDYGVYINPWIKKTGSKSEPGYIEPMNKLIDKYVVDLEKAYAIDIENMIMKSYKK